MRPKVPVLLLALCMAAPLRAQVADPELAALLERVQFWQERNREDLAREALDRALRRAPDDPEALMLLARYQLRQNLEREAAATLERMRAANPKHANVARLSALLRVHGPDRERLRQARQLARAGRNDEAARAYRAIFPDAFPDDDVALEYAQVLGWTREGWEQARQILADLERRHPNDARYRVALVAHVSTRKPVAPATFAALRELAASPTVAVSRQAKEAWRRAVIALDPVEASLPALRDYIAANPGETAVTDRLAQVQAIIARRGSAPAGGAPASPAGPKAKAWAAFEAGRFDEAQALFEQALAAQPRDGEPVGGLGLVRMRQGRHAEALELFERARSLDDGRRAKWEEMARSARYWLLLQQAREAREKGELEAAHARASEARSLDAQEPNAPAELARIQAAMDARSAARHREAAKRLQEEGRDAEAIAALESAAALDRDDPWLRLDLARLLARRGESARAERLFAELIGRGPARAEARYAYAIFLSGIDREPDALVALEAIPAAERSANMTRLQRRLWTTVQVERALAQAQLGRRAEAEQLLGSAQAAVGGERELAIEIARAFDRIGADAPLRAALEALAAGPSTREESEALGRLKLSLRLREADAREAAGGPEEALKSLRAWVPQALEDNPGDARLLELSSRLAERDGLIERAIDDEQRSLAQGGGHVYRYRRLAELLDRQATWHSAALDGLSRSGSAGKTRVSAQELALGLVRGESGGSRFFARIAPVRVSSGALDLDDAAEAGTYGSALLCRPFCVHPADDEARGVSLTGGFEREGLRFDLGTSPLGFRVANVVGGLLHRGGLGGGFSYSIDAARRPVASSLLSYAGARDPNTGRTWGGVVQTGARLNVSRDSGGEHGAWALAGAYRLTGRDVQSNDKAEAMAGYYRRIVNEEDRFLTAGATGMWWHFRRNAGEYTFGHGGYYSPKSYRSIAFPVAFGLRTERASFTLRASVSAAWSSGRAAPFFPTDEELQARAQAMAGTTFTEPSYAASATDRSFGRALGATWEYQLGPRLFAGGRVELERSTNYTPNRFLLYLRMADPVAARPVALPPEPGLPGWQY